MPSRIEQRVDTIAKSITGAKWPHLFLRMLSIVAGTYWLTSASSHDCSCTSMWSLSSVNLSSHDWKYGGQLMSLSLRKSTPARETVAGEPFFKFEISKIRRIDGDSGMRSLETSVSTLLSSMTCYHCVTQTGENEGRHGCYVGGCEGKRTQRTVFIDSIHSASMSPSRMTHLGTLVCAPVAFLKSRMIFAMIPSYGSLVTGCT